MAKKYNEVTPEILGMGVKGAALATIISQAVSCGWVLAFLTGKKTFLRIKKEYLKPVPSIVFPCLALGALPQIVHNLLILPLQSLLHLLRPFCLF